MIFVPVSLKQTAVYHARREPLFIAKNGYGDLVVMSIDEEHRTVVIVTARYSASQFWSRLICMRRVQDVCKVSVVQQQKRVRPLGITRRPDSL